MGKKSVESNARATGGVTGKGFQPGQSGNPGGRSPLPPEVKEALKADTLKRYERLQKLSVDAEEMGDLKTAAMIELALFKKQVPDLSSIELKGEDGEAVKVAARIDVRTLTQEQLEQLRAMQVPK